MRIFIGMDLQRTQAMSVKSNNEFRTNDNVMKCIAYRLQQKMYHVPTVRDALHTQCSQ